MGKRQKDDPLTDAQWELVKSHIDLPDSIALGFISRARVYGFELQDIAAEGMQGLIAAAKGYDPLNEASFAGYAKPCIKGYIMNFFRDRARLIKMPRKLVKEIAQSGKQESIVMSLNNSMHEDEKTKFEEVYGYDDDFTSPYVKDFLGRLDERERKIMELRLRGLVQKQIGLELGIAQITVSRVLERIGKKYLQQ